MNGFNLRLLRYIVLSVLPLSLIIMSCENQKIKSSKSKSDVLTHKSEVNWVGHWQNEGKRQKLVDEVASEYEFLNQEIKVNLKYMDSIMLGATDAMEIELIAKEATSPNPRFDIIRVKDYYSRVANYLNDPEWTKKYLVDFSEDPDFKATHQEFLLNDEYKADNGGITVGPYNEGFYWAVWYNKEVADKMGIKVKSLGMTSDDFIGYVKQAHEYNLKNNTSIAPIFNARDWLTLDVLVSQLFYSIIGDVDKIKNTEYNPAKIKALEKVIAVFDEIGKYESSFKDRSKYGWWPSLSVPLDGECLFYIQGSWMYNIWENIDATKVRKMYPAEIPTMDGTAPCYPGGFKACWAVLKNAKHKEEAIKLLKYWTSPQISESWVRYTKCPTGIKGNLAQVSLGLDQFEDFQYQLSKKFDGKLVKPTDSRYILGIRNKDVQIPVIDILEHKKTGAQVMSELRRQLK